MSVRNAIYGVIWIVAAVPAICRADELSAAIDASCNETGRGAAKAMEYRQIGGNAADMLRRLREHADSSTNPYAVVALYEQERLLTAAFELPRHYTPEMQARAISEFENAAFLACRKTARAAAGIE